MFPWSVIPTAGCPSATALATTSGIRAAPSSIEYSVCRCRWTNDRDDTLTLRAGRVGWLAGLAGWQGWLAGRVGWLAGLAGCWGSWLARARDLTPRRSSTALWTDLWRK